MSEQMSGRPREPQTENFDWGAFRFTLRKKKGLQDAWAWQCRCPFHRRSAVTECKKEMTVPKGDWEAQSMNTLLTLKHWANQAKNFGRQRYHKGTTLIIGQHPVAEFIEAQMIEEGPRSRPLTDDALDENEDTNLFWPRLPAVPHLSSSAQQLSG